MVAPQYWAIASILISSGSRIPSASRTASGATYKEGTLPFLALLEFLEHPQHTKLLKAALDIHICEVLEVAVLKGHERPPQLGLPGHDEREELSAVLGSARQGVRSRAK